MKSRRITYFSISSLFPDIGQSTNINGKNKPNDYFCNNCFCRFLKLSDYERHIVECNTEELQFKCCICWKSFRHKCHLTRHMLIHSGERPFACNHCPKRFTQKGNLLTHLRTHTGEAPFHCTSCPRRFKDKSNLNWHIKKYH